MDIYEASSFYGDYRMLLEEVAEELSTEKVESTTLGSNFFNDFGFAIENLILNCKPV